MVPFGFGLSYTTWTYAPAASAEVIHLDKVRSMIAATEAANRTFPTLALREPRVPLVAYQVRKVFYLPLHFVRILLTILTCPPHILQFKYLQLQACLSRRMSCLRRFVRTTPALAFASSWTTT